MAERLDWLLAPGALVTTAVFGAPHVGRVLWCDVARRLVVCDWKRGATMAAVVPVFQGGVARVDVQPVEGQ